MDWETEPVTRRELVARQEWLDGWENTRDLTRYVSHEGTRIESSGSNATLVQRARTQEYYDEDQEVAARFREAHDAAFQSLGYLVEGARYENMRRRALEAQEDFYETVTDLVDAFVLEDFDIEVYHIEYRRQRRRANAQVKRRSFWSRFIALFRLLG